MDSEVWHMASKDIEDAILEAVNPTQFRLMREADVL